jgi:tetratricopeptide (TPR) repeat protein
LVAEILKKMPDLPASLRSLIVDSSDGNPFYAEELVKMLIDDRVIIIDSEGSGGGPADPDDSALTSGGDGQSSWRVDPTRLGQVKVPPTLAGILLTRLDGLPGEERAVLQRASVVGRIFWDELVTELAADAVEPEAVPHLLAAARGHELVFHRDYSRFAGCEEFIFKHAILRDVTYETVLLSLRPRYHAQVAAWLEEHAGERLDEYVRQIAGHYEAAGNRQRAAEYLSRSGEQLLKVSAFRDARKTFESALRLLEPESVYSARRRAARARMTEEGAAGTAQPPLSKAVLELRGCLLVDLGRALLQLGEHGEAQNRLMEALPIVHSLNDRSDEVAALVVLADIDYREGDYTGAETHLQDALALARPAGDRAGVALVTFKLAAVTRMSGQYAEAMRWADESRALYAELGDRQGAAAAIRTLGVVAKDSGDYEAAVTHQEQSLDLSRQIGDRLGVAVALNNLGVIGLIRGTYAAARTYFEQYRAVATEIGDRWGAAVAAVNIGEAYLEEGQNEPAWQNLRLGLQQSSAIKDLPGCLYVLADMARLLLSEGQAERAGELLGLALNHPATDNEVAEAAQPALDILRKTLPSAQLETALERGKGLDLSRTIEESVRSD